MCATQCEGKYKDKEGNVYQPLSTFSATGSPFWLPETAGGPALRSAYKAVHEYIAQQLEAGDATTSVDSVLENARANACSKLGQGKHTKIPKSAREFYNMLRSSGQLAADVAAGGVAAGGVAAGSKRKRGPTGSN